MKNVKTLSVVATLAVILFVMTVTPAFIVSNTFAAVPGDPHAADAMWIEPSTIDLSTDTVSEGYKFNVTVWINLTVACSSWEFNLVYNKNHLNATGCDYTAGGASDFFKGMTTIPLTPTFGVVNSTHNSVLHGEVAFMSTRDPGYGSLAWIEFEVMALPPEGETYTSKLDIASSYPGDTYAQDASQAKIALNVLNSDYRIGAPGAPPEKASLTVTTSYEGSYVDVFVTLTGPSGPLTGTTSGSNGYTFSNLDPGSYTVSGTYQDISRTASQSLSAGDSKTVNLNFAGSTPPLGETVLCVNPPNITDPTMGPSSVFNINVTIANVSDMRICEFNLTYDPDIIGFFGINIFKVQDQVPTTQMMLDDNAGFIWMELTYPTGITTESSALVTITFHVESYGASVLDLHDTIITDSNGDPIPHEVQDGLFLTLICDVAIVDVYTSRNSTYTGFDINVTVIAKNLGDQNETFAVTAYYDNFEIGNATVVDLQPSEEVAFIFVWDTQNVVPCTNYTISARAPIAPYELNTTNNEYIDGQVEIRILGDIDGDGKVRVDDVYIAASAFGSSVGSPRWEPAADINGDGSIRVDDLFLIASNFGACCPP